MTGERRASLAHGARHDRDRSEGSPEPVVAHGARMSWAGVLRPGDEFCRVVRSRLATLTGEAGAPLRRYLGTWSTRYRRYTTNLSSPRVTVRPVEPGARPGGGLQGILHWVERRDLLRTGRGGVCEADGWPAELWERFSARLDELPEGSVGEKLSWFLASTLESEVPIVSEWRARVLGGSVAGGGEGGSLGERWVPVPARLETSSGTSACILSWSPTPRAFVSPLAALEARGPAGETVDRVNQAKYYLECLLGRLHGVAFGHFDAVEDRSFAQIPEVAGLAEAYGVLERSRIADPRRGRLDRFG